MAEALAIPVFKEIWTRDKTKAKEKASVDLSFIYYNCSLDSVYHNFPEEERERRVASDLSDFDWKPDKVVMEGLKKYRELHKSRGRKLLEDAEFAIDKIGRYYRVVDLTEKDRSGKPMYTAKDLLSNIKSVGELFKTVNVLKKEIDKEETSTGIIRGGGVQGPMEDPEDVIN